MTADFGKEEEKNVYAGYVATVLLSQLYRTKKSQINVSFS
jgi:hypothetical protein